MGSEGTTYELNSGERRLLRLVRQGRSRDPRTRNDAFAELQRLLRPLAVCIKRRSFKFVRETDFTSICGEVLVKTVRDYREGYPVSAFYQLVLKRGLLTHLKSASYTAQLHEIPFSVISVQDDEFRSTAPEYIYGRCDPDFRRAEHRETLVTSLGRLWPRLSLLERYCVVLHGFLGLSLDTTAAILRERLPHRYDCRYEFDYKSADNALQRARRKALQVNAELRGDFAVDPYAQAVPTSIQLAQAQAEVDYELLDALCRGEELDPELFDRLLRSISQLPPDEPYTPPPTPKWRRKKRKPKKCQRTSQANSRTTS